MYDQISTGLIRKVAIAALLVAGSIWFARHQTAALLTSQKTATQNESPAIVITTPKAPLQILSTWIENTAPANFRLVLQVQNQSGKGIRAFAVNSLIATSQRQNGNSQFQNITQRASIWQPTEIRSIEVADSLDDQVRSVKLTVDFIEFADGTTWGSDAENSRDLLAGEREGAKLERQRLIKVMHDEGSAALAKEVEADETKARGDAGDATAHSRKWQDGYRQGVAAVRRRLRPAIASGKPDKIKTELSRPFDTAEEEAPK